MKTNELLENIQDILKDIRVFFRVLYESIRKVIKWFPVIWRDRDWDHYYFFILLHKKLEMMEKEFQKPNCWIVHPEKISSRIKIAKLLCKRIIDDKYCDIAFINHDKKWGKTLISYGPEDKNGCCEVFIKKENVITKEDEEIETKEFKKCIEHQKYLEKQDIDYLFQFLSKHIQSWWW